MRPRSGRSCGKPAGGLSQALLVSLGEEKPWWKWGSINLADIIWGSEMGVRSFDSGTALKSHTGSGGGVGAL